MKSFNQIVLGVSILTSSTFFASCAKFNSQMDDKPNSVVEQARPQKLDFKNPVPGAPLTKAQVTEIKQTFGSKKSTLSLPPTKLLLKDHDSKLNENELLNLRYDEYMLQYTMNEETYSFYKALRAACRKQHGTLNLDFTIPIEKITSINDLKAGDHFISSVMGNYGGNTCDVETSANMAYKVQLDRLDKEGLASAQVSYGLKALMKNPKYAKMLNSKGIILSSSVSGVVSKQDVNTEEAADSEANLKFNIDGSYFTLTKEIPFKSTYTVYAKGLADKSAELQTEVHFDINMGTFTASIQSQIVTIIYNDKDMPTKVESEKYFVNGHEKTKDEIKELIGDNLRPKQAQDVMSVYLN